ncbi:MAG: hypothetical protein C0597_08560 [Marinilabiliales bacterium]|nr:MAG: hypothetical protein C0597_08560 [Marinilabiliales bacterium]
MKKIELIFIICSFLILLSCDESDKIESFDHVTLTEALVNLDGEKLQIEIDKLTIDLKPKISLTDNLGHSENLNTLIERLNSQSDNFEASLFCYACIKTNPPQSEIFITVDSLGIEVCRVLDILTAENKTLSFSSIHECNDSL